MIKFTITLVVFTIFSILTAAGEVEKLEKHNVKNADSYNHTRDLQGYANELNDSFINQIFSLGVDDVWIDSGAGDALAQIGYLNAGGLATLVAIDARPPNQRIQTVVDDFTPVFMYLSGRYVEAYSPTELPRAAIITDVLGAIAYTSKLDRTLYILLSTLKEGGSLFFKIDDDTYAEDVRPDHDRIVIERVTANGLVPVPIALYFRAIKGVEFFAHVNLQGRVSHKFVRTRGPILVPSLKILNYVEGSPPKRIFIWKD